MQLNGDLVLLNPNAPYFILVAVKRIYADLPILVTQDTWGRIQPQVDAYIATLEAQPNAYLVSTQLLGLLARYEPARQRLTEEITVQEVISQNIASQMQRIGASLGVDSNSIDGLTAAAYAHLNWKVDPETIPAPDDSTNRGITISESGTKMKTVKFKNMSLDLSDFAKIAAGFFTTATNIVDKPQPLVMVAGILLTICALHDAMKIDLSEQEASVFWGMIQATGDMRGAGLHEATILATTNTNREQYGLALLNEKQVHHSLTKLAQIKSIEKTGDNYYIIEHYKIKD